MVFLAAVVFFAAAFFVVALAVTPPLRLPLGAFLTATSPPRGSFFVPLTRSLKPWPAAEARHRGLLDPDPLPGLGVAGVTGRTLHLLERAETGDRDPVPRDNRADDRVQDRVHRVRRVLPTADLVGNRFNELRLVHVFPFGNLPGDWVRAFSHARRIYTANQIRNGRITLVPQRTRHSGRVLIGESAFIEVLHQSIQTPCRTCEIVLRSGGDDEEFPAQLNPDLLGHLQTRHSGVGLLQPGSEGRVRLDLAAVFHRLPFELPSGEGEESCADCVTNSGKLPRNRQPNTTQRPRQRRGRCVVSAGTGGKMPGQACRVRGLKEGRFASYAEMSGSLPSVRLMSSRPFSSRQRALSSSSKAAVMPSARTSRASRSTVISAVGSASVSFQSCSTVSCGRMTVSRPFFSEFPRKMSAKRDEMTALKP